MSFGYGVSDILSLLQLANKIRQRFVDSPNQFKAVQNEVSSVSAILGDIESVSRYHELTGWQKDALQPILKECHGALTALGEIVDKNSSLQSPLRNGLREKSRRVWARLTWEPKEVQALQSRLTLSVGLLTAFNGNLIRQLSLTTKTSIDLLDKRQHAREQSEENRAIINWLNWLSTTDFFAQQADFIRIRHPGTGTWLLKSNEFQDWVDESRRTLFCPGIPGAGKTIMAATVVDELYTRFQTDPSVHIAYIYCNYRQPQQPEDLLLGLLKQLAQDQPSIPDPVKYLHTRYKMSPRRPSVEEISKVLQAVTSLSTKVFIVVDGLDELREPSVRTSFLSQIFDLQTNTDVSFFATSRFIPEIYQIFEKSVTLEIRARDGDVRRYLDDSMPKLPLFVRSSPDLEEDIQTEITKAVGGMFLLAKLHLNSLIGKRSPKLLKMALNQLPSGSGAYDAAYEEVMERISNQAAESANLARRVITWVAYSKRFLSVIELQHALAIEPGESNLDQDNIIPVEDLVSVCDGLVVIDEGNKIVRLAHYTAQEYFNRTLERWFLNAEADIATACITYVLFKTFQSEPSDMLALQVQIQSNPLYDYAAKFWGYHFRNSAPEDWKLGHLVMDFLENKSAVAACARVRMPWQSFVDRWNITDFQISRYQSTGLHLAAIFGLYGALQTLILRGHDPDPKDSLDNTPLMLAAASGNKRSVQILLETGKVNLEAKDGEGRTALIRSARAGRLGIVKQLLETGKIDPDSRENNGRTALFHAAREGEDDVIKVLLSNKGVDPNSEDRYGSTPISVAARNGREESVKLLLEKENVRFDSKDQFGHSPIFWAAIKGHSGIVKVLEEKYNDAGKIFCDDELLKGGRPTISGRGRLICDVCELQIADNETHYHCEVCNLGNFDICQQCFEFGVSCLTNSHKLVERTVEGMIREAAAKIGSTQI